MHRKVHVSTLSTEVWRGGQETNRVLRKLAVGQLLAAHCVAIFTIRLWKNGASKQCCGTAMICCGSGSRSGQYLAQFSNRKFVQNLAISISWKVGLSFWIFDFFYITFYVGSGSKFGSGTAVHSGSGATTLLVKSGFHQNYSTRKL
jgi:hypothetical protein